MDPEEIARKELEKMEKKKRKHEKKLLKSQSRHLHSPGGLSLHSAPSSDTVSSLKTNTQVKLLFTVSENLSQFNSKLNF